MSNIQLSDYVENQYGKKGIVIELYDTFYKVPMRSMSHQDWLDQQLVPFSEEEINQKWAVVWSDAGGAFQSCESKLNKVERGENND